MIDALAAGIVHWLIGAVVFGTLLAGITWGLTQSALRGARPAIHAAFWLIVLGRFVLPSAPGFEYSLASLVGPILPASGAAPAPEPRAATQPGYYLLPVAPDAPASAARPHPTPAHRPAVSEPRRPLGHVDWMRLLAAAYVAGVVLVAGLRIAAYRRFLVRCNRLPAAGRGVVRLTGEVCRRSALRRVPVVRLSDEVRAPFVYGLFRPTLVLSTRQTLSRSELEAVLLHEVAHLRRFDLAVRHLQWLAGTLLFFWPIVAWVNRRIDLAREHACDEWALRHGRLRPGEYARCLLRALAPRAAGGSLLAFRPAAMAANITHVERRIAMIMDLPSRGRRARGAGLVAGLGLAAWAGFALSGAAAQVGEQPQDAATPATGERVVVHVNHWAVAGPEGEQQVVLQMIGGPDADGPVRMLFDRRISPETLAAFAEAHPRADADADGAVTQDEHDAYLVARAMAQPDAVLAAFPHADADADGALSVEEAAGLVAGPPPMHGPGGHAGVADGQAVGLRRVVLAHQGAAQAAQQMEPLLESLAVDPAAGDAQPLTVTTDVRTNSLVIAGPQGDVDQIAEVIGADIDVPESQGHAMAVVRFLDSAGQVREHVVAVDSADGELPEISVDAGSSARAMQVQLARDGQVQTVTVDPETGAVSGLEGDQQVQVWTVGPDGEMPAELQARLTELHGVLAAEAGAALAPVIQSDASAGTFEVAFALEPMAGGESEALDDRGQPAAGGAMPVMQMLMSPARWLLDNIEADPTPEEVSAYISAVRDAPLAAMLRMHPEADLDGDGQLTEQERDLFIEQRLSAARERLLEAYPGADTDGDGRLSDDELREAVGAPPAGGPGGRFKVFISGNKVIRGADHE